MGVSTRGVHISLQEDIVTDHSTQFIRTCMLDPSAQSIYIGMLDTFHCPMMSKKPVLSESPYFKLDTSSSWLNLSTILWCCQTSVAMLYDVENFGEPPP